jgi:hypothetical protein
VGWSFSVELPADRAGCSGAADTLRSAARAAAAAADFLAGQAALSPVEFSGVTAQSYRTTAAALETDCRGSAADTTALADALDLYAMRINEIRRVLTHLRDHAVRAGLELTSDDLVLWPPAPTTEQDRIYQRLEATASDARIDEQAAHEAWWRAVQLLTKGPLPSRA